MNTTKVLWLIGSAIAFSFICYWLWGLEGAIFGFICTWLIIVSFKIWNMIFLLEER